MSIQSSSASRDNSFTEGNGYRGDYLSNEKDLDGVVESGCLFIIVLSASGDLAKKTFPALYHLFHQGFLPSNEVHIFGYARTKMADDDLRQCIRGYLSKGEDSVERSALEFSAADQICQWIL